MVKLADCTPISTDPVLPLAGDLTSVSLLIDMGCYRTGVWNMTTHAFGEALTLDAEQSSWQENGSLGCRRPKNLCKRFERLAGVPISLGDDPHQRERQRLEDPGHSLETLTLLKV